MARSLAANLTTALARDNHEPSIELTSQSFADTIPFDGNAFNFNNDYTWRPSMIYHSTGRLCCLVREVVAGDSNDDSVSFIYTDTDRTVWTKVAISGLDSGVEGNIDYLALCEKTDGNLGVVMARHGNSDTSETIYSATISATGTLVTAPAQIATHTRHADGDYGTTGLAITKWSDDSYYVVYCYTTASGWYIYKLTSSNFTAWTGPTQVSPSGFTTGSYEEVQGVYLFEDTVEHNDCFMLISYTDTVEDAENKVYNVYSMISADYGATWGAPSARTAYTDNGSGAETPVLVQKTSGQLTLVFYARSGVLRMDENTTGFNDSSFGSCPKSFSVRTFYYNASTDHITCSYGQTSNVSGTKCLCGVLVIDLSTWTIIDNFYDASSPAISQAFADVSIFEGYQEFAQGTKFAIATYSGIYGATLIMVIDVEARSVTYYCICEEAEDPWSAYGITGNITVTDYDWWPNRTPAIPSSPDFGGICLNETDGDTLYVMWKDDSPADAKGFYIASIDLTASPVGGEYSVTWIGDEHGAGYDQYELIALKYLSVIDSVDYVIASAGGQGGSVLGSITIIDGSSGATLYNWRTLATSGFPYYGPYGGRPRYYDGHLYFNVMYYSAVAYQNQRGMCDVTIATETFSFKRPTWASVDDYDLFGYYAVDSSNNQLWLAPFTDSAGGSFVTAAIYDIASGAWTAYTYQTFPGMPKAFSPSNGQNIFYDATTQYVGVGLGYSLHSSEYGCILLSTAVDFAQLKYLQAVDDGGGGWTWDAHGDIAALTKSTVSRNGTAAVDTDDIMWVIWDDYYNIDQVYIPYWDRDMGAVSLIDYLTGEVKIKWELKKPNTLDFTLTRGHLYDPQNSYSALRDIVKKGRLITVQMGENYQGSAYLENQGTYLVMETRLQYGREQYPKIKVRAESQSVLWKEQKIVSTQLFTAAPNDAIETILSTHGGMDAADYDIPEFFQEHNIDHQFVDQTIWDMIEELCDHWFYVPYDDPDGVFTCVYVNLYKAVDHTYSDLTQIQEFSSDDSYSDFTNAVRVTGESDTFIDVLYDEELIETLAGSVGWWELESDHTVRYGKEGKTRKCRNPRLNIVQSVGWEGFIRMLATGQAGEEISSEDANETYCIVTITIPDLSAAAIASIVTMVGVGAAAAMCDGYVTGFCGPMIVALSGAVAFTMYILAAVANYQYELYARPVGQERQTVQYLASDTIHQQQMGGKVVQKDIDDSLCYSVNECQRVAAATLAMIQAQRDRVRFRKVAHMQDEILDKISVLHPYSSETMEVIITGITRIYRKGVGSSDGFWDEIEGWRMA